MSTIIDALSPICDVGAVKSFHTSLKRRRTAHGMLQQELARRACISRQALSALEAGRMVPSTAVALRLARALSCRVEELFWLDDEDAPLEAELAGAPPGRTPGRYLVGQLDGRWVAHPIDSAHSTAPADGLGLRPEKNGALRIRPLRPAGAIASNLLVAGCDPALGLLAEAWRDHRPGSRLAWLNASSTAALELLRRGQVHLAGAHLLDERSGQFNLPVVKRLLPDRRVVIVRLARTEAGLVVRPGNPHRARRIEDLSRARLKLVNREQGAGARQLLDRLLLRARIPSSQIQGYQWEVRGQLQVAQAVALGAADAGIATRSAAVAQGVDFVPLADERFDLIFPAASMQDERIARLVDLLGSRPFRRELAALGYDTSESGHVVGEVSA